jgi:hypothetical protein
LEDFAMPIHDWTRVRANRFHDFHQSWTVVLTNSLNAGGLPPGYFAMVERKEGDPRPDFIALDLPHQAGGRYVGIAASLHPPRTRFVARVENDCYVRKANRVTVRHPEGDVVAVIEIVSPGNKPSRHAVHSFARKAVQLLQAGIHLLVVDLFPPGPRDPQGIHKVIWDRLQDEPFSLPPDKPLTAAAYAVGTETVAYVEPLAVGDPLPDMPVFLTAEWYVPCPLEATYRIAWDQFPAPLKGPLESPPPP